MQPGHSYVDYPGEKNLETGRGAGLLFMPITLSITGHADLSPHRLTRAEAREWLEKAALWFEGLGDAVLDARLLRDAEDKAVLLVVFHPAVSPAEVRLGASGRVRVSAATSPAGPGYHIYLCEVLRLFATDFDLTWAPEQSTDPTGYFINSDRLACERHFFKCLGAWCASDPNASYLGLPANHGFTYPAEVLTPLGPQSHEWLRRVAADPIIGQEFYPWWNAKLDAAFYRNRALTRLWCEFPWRAPLNEAEGEEADQIANDLAAAFKLDPSIELPWGEWLEVLSAIENDRDDFTVTPKDTVLSVELWKRTWDHTTTSSVKHSGPRIGYRRHPVRVALTAGWSVLVPGDFAREWDDDRTWTGWNLTRTVWFHALGFTKPDGGHPTAAEALEVGRKSLPEGEPVAGLEGEEVHGSAVFGSVDEDGRTVWRLSGVAAVDGQLAVCNVYAEAAGDRPWTEATWQSLQHAKQ